MSTRPTRARFQPNVLRGEGSAAANAHFAEQAQRLGLAWTCVDCAYFDPSSRGCTVGWPNHMLVDCEKPVMNEDGFPAFCKAFEPE